MILAGFIDHVWQSSLFVVLAWGLASLLRRNGAHLRHGIWCAASLKFLVPFSMITFIGSKIGENVMGLGTNGSISGAVQQAAAPFIAPATFIASPDSHLTGLAELALMMAWAIGASALVLRWFARWRELNAIVRAAIPSAINAPIPVLSSPTLLEPGVVGIRRPVLLLPEAIAGRLDDGQLQAIVEHELCHVRRRDNLTSALHMIVETVFWFHPLVWWIGARLIHERERACDEAVVRSGHEAQTYAEGILNVCRHYVASKLACVSGVSGADLETRLEAIMKNEAVDGLSRAKSLLLGTTALAILAAPVLVGLTLPSRAQAQTPDAKAQGPTAVTTVGKIQLIDGKRVKLKYQNADVRALLKALADAAQVNLLVSEKVGGTVSVDLAEMPWEQALTIVLNAMGLVKHEKDGIIFVDSATKIA
jgi:beta-lactamase regulating signal transducer with metallopeptidase domain